MRCMDMTILGALGDSFLAALKASGSRATAMEMAASEGVSLGLAVFAVRYVPLGKAALALCYSSTKSYFLVSMRGVAIETELPELTDWEAIHAQADLDMVFQRLGKQLQPSV